MKIKNKLLYLLGVVGLTFAVGFNAFDSKVVKADDVPTYQCESFYCEYINFNLVTLQKNDFYFEMTGTLGSYISIYSHSTTTFNFVTSDGSSYVDYSDSYTESYGSLETILSFNFSLGDFFGVEDSNGEILFDLDITCEIELSNVFIRNVTNSSTTQYYASCPISNLNCMDSNNLLECSIFGLTFDGYGIGNFDTREQAFSEGYNSGYDVGYDDGVDKYLDIMSECDYRSYINNISFYSRGNSSLPWISVDSQYWSYNNGRFDITNGAGTSVMRCCILINLTSTFKFNDFIMQFKDSTTSYNSSYFKLYLGNDINNLGNDFNIPVYYDTDDKSYYNNTSRTLENFSSFFIIYSPFQVSSYHIDLGLYGYDFGLINDLQMYDSGYSDGYTGGYTNGYNYGYAVAQDLYENEDERISSIFGGIGSIALLPLDMFFTIFNFQIFGIDMRLAVSAILSVLIVIAIIKLVKGL